MPDLNEDAIRSYLLDLPADETEQAPSLERRLIEDEEFQELVEVVETELIDDYVNGDLTPAEEGLFESHFLSTPQRRRQVSFAASLRRIGETKTSPAEHKQPARSFFSAFADFLAALYPTTRWAMAAASIVVIALPVLLLVRTGNLTHRIATLESRLNSSFGTVGVVLEPGALRSTGSLAQVRLPQTPSLVQVQLRLLTDPYEFYRVVVTDASGSEILSQSRLTATEIDGVPSLEAAFPSSAFAPGDYTIVAIGLTNQGSYERFEGSHYSLRFAR